MAGGNVTTTAQPTQETMEKGHASAEAREAKVTRSVHQPRRGCRTPRPESSDEQVLKSFLLISPDCAVASLGSNSTTARLAALIALGQAPELFQAS